MNIYLKIGGVVWFIVIFSLVLIATTYTTNADKDFENDSSCKEYGDFLYACFPLSKSSSEYNIGFQGSDNNSFHIITIEGATIGESFFALWDFNRSQCNNVEHDSKLFLFCAPGAPPKELIPRTTDTLILSHYIWIEGVTFEPNLNDDDPHLISAGERIGKITSGTITIKITKENTFDTPFQKIKGSYKDQWEILFGVRQESVTETLSADEFCGAVEEKYKAYKPEGIPLTSSQTLTLQVSGYPTFGIGNDGTSLNTIVEDSFSLSSVVAYLYRSSLVIAGIVAFLSLLYGGILFIMSGDSPDKRRQAVSRVQKVFFGAFILLTAVLTFEFIGLDINATRSLELEVETSEGGLELPNDRNTILIRNTENHDYYGIPFTNRAGASRVYGDLITKVPSECLGCRHNTGHTKEMACHFACDSTALLRDKVYSIGEFAGYDRLKNYLYAVRECANERDKSVYKDVGDTIQYALVRDDDDTPVSCTAACIKLAGDSGAKCDSAINEEQNEKFKKWLEEKLGDYRAIPINETLYPNFFLFERKNSLNDSYLQDKSDKDRSGLRKCIGENYIIDAQQFPTIESRDNSTDICVCKSPS